MILRCGAFCHDGRRWQGETRARTVVRVSRLGAFALDARVLLVSQDDYFAPLDREQLGALRVEYVSPRARSLTPGARAVRSWGPLVLAKIVLNLARRRYDVVVLPGITLGVTIRKFRRQDLLRALLNLGLVRAMVRRWFRAVPLIVICHREAQLELRDPLRELTGAPLYLKSNLRLSDWSPPSVDHLPYYIAHDHALRLAADHREKDIQVFFAGELHRGRRERVDDMARALAARGVTVDRHDRRLPLNEFAQQLARARVVLSPEGIGWHCYRHYEALAAGAIPVINAPVGEPIVTNLVHGRNAIIYDDVERGADDIVAFLEGRLGALSADELRAFAMERGTEAAVGTLLLQLIAGESPDHGPLAPTPTAL